MAKITIKPVGPPSPYVDYPSRCVAFYECVISLSRSRTEQMIELMVQEDIIDPLPSPRFKSKLMQRRARQA